MALLGNRTSAVVAAAMILTGTAQADVTAQDVWSDWTAVLEGTGYQISATETRSGDTLTVDDLELTAPSFAEDSTTVVRLGPIDFRENDDGSVNILYPETMQVQVDAKTQTSRHLEITMEMRLAGMSTVVTGVATDMTSTYVADTLEMVLTDLNVDGDAVSLQDTTARFLLDTISGTIQSTVGGKRTYAQRMQAATASYALAFTAPEGGGEINATGTLDNLMFDNNSALPLAVVQASDLSALLAAGMAVDAAFTYESGTSDMSAMVDGRGSNIVQSTSDGGSFNVVMDADSLTYSGVQDALQISISSSATPIPPIDLAIGNSQFNLTFPVQQTDGMQDIALGLGLSDFSMSEAIWAMFDPGQKLPRDPATVALDLTGKARWLFDILDPTALAVTAENPIPGEIERLDLNRLLIRLAGAQLTGKGAFTFDNSDPSDPLKPTGTVDLSLSGANTLIDSLVAMGLLPEEQAMGARLMMGLLAVPGDAPDTLNSRIEVNEQGHILANGQRIQ